MYVLNMIPYDWFEEEEDVNRSRRNSAGRDSARNRTRYNLRDRSVSLTSRMRAFFGSLVNGDDDDDEEYVDDDDEDEDEDVEIERPDLLQMLRLLRARGVQVTTEDGDDALEVLEGAMDEEKEEDDDDDDV